MKIRTLVIIAVTSFAGLLAAPPAFSQVSVGFGIRFGPPPLRYERVLERPFPHAVWIRGHWAWSPRFDRYVWVRGYWVAERPGFVWFDGQWSREGRGWMWKEGHWRQESREHEFRHEHERRRGGSDDHREWGRGRGDD